MNYDTISVIKNDIYYDLDDHSRCIYFLSTCISMRINYWHVI